MIRIAALTAGPQAPPARIELVDSLQTVDRHGVARTANRTKDQEVIVPPPTAIDGAKRRVETKEYKVTDWCFSKRRLQ